MNNSKPARNKLAFILYEGQAAPRYYEFKKAFFKTLIYGLPIITLVSLLTAGTVLFYFREIRNIAAKKEPAIITNLRQEKSELAKINEKQLLTIKDLESRLAKGVDTEHEFSSLNLFKKTAGAKDLSTNPPISLESMSATPTSKGIKFQFNIVNITKSNERIAGYIFVVMKNENQISIWPAQALPQDEMKLSFNAGEDFATARFRPVDGVFPIKAEMQKGSMKALFKILIFSRAGDLMHKKIFSQTIQF